jgi:hypothetical protein
VRGGFPGPLGHGVKIEQYLNGAGAGYLVN